MVHIFVLIFYVLAIIVVNSLFLFTKLHFIHMYYKFTLFLSRKSIYKGTHNVIHFNLTLSLTIGLIIFVSAVETAKDNKVANTVYT